MTKREKTMLAMMAVAGVIEMVGIRRANKSGCRDNLSDVLVLGGFGLVCAAPFVALRSK